MEYFETLFGANEYGADESLRQALDALRGDPLYKRIPACDLRSIAGDALAAGRVKADAVVGKFGVHAPFSIAACLGVRIVFDISRRPKNSYSRYLRKPPTIVIYESNMRKMRESRAADGEDGSNRLITGLANACAATELYYHLEYESKQFANLAYRVKLLDLGFLKIEKSLSALSGIAAREFSRRLAEIAARPGAPDISPRNWEL